MPPIQDQGKSILKLAQFQKCKGKQTDRKYIELILQELDPNLKVSSTDLLGEYGRHLIGDTLLHVVYAEESVDALDILMSKGADYNVKNKEGKTVLHMAFYCVILSSEHERFKWNIFQKTKKSQFISSILSAQVKYNNTENSSDPYGLTHFHVACATNNVEAVEFFLKNGVPVDQAVLKEGFQGYTGLHFASQFGCLRVIEILLEHGANGNLEDAKGRNPLYIALERNMAMISSAVEAYSLEDIQGNEQIIQLLIDLNFTDKCSFLHITSSLQSTAKLENYLTQDVDVNQCTSMDSQSWSGYTALHFAAHISLDTVKLLMKHGADIEAKNVNGVTPFDMCIKRYKAEDISGLMGMVPKWKDIVLSDQKTKLIDLLLAFKDSKEIQNFLKKSDKNIKLFVPFDSPLWPGFTVLHIAVLLSERTECKSDYKEKCFRPDLTVITEILKEGADLTTKDHRSWTPVHFAFKLGRQRVLTLLLRYHYRMQNPIDDENLSHLHIACASRNRDFIERILQNDIDVNIPYKGKTLYESVFPGWTPLHVAFFAYDEKIARLLLKSGANPHIPDACTFTPVHFSMYDFCTIETGERLFSSPNLSDHVVEKVGLSYLHVACSIPNLDAIKRLLDLGVDVNQVVTTEKLNEDSVYWRIWDFKCRNGDTPLHTAMRSLHCSSDLISLLIERGADILARNAEDEFPLEIILDLAREELLDVLMAALRRDVDLRRRVEMETGITLLHVASRMDDVDFVKELLDDGADVMAQIPYHEKFWPGISPLLVAYDKLCFPLGGDLSPTVTQMSLLLKAHKNFNVNPTIAAGISHFHIACHMLDVEVVEKFLENGVDVNGKIDVFCDADIAGCSPLLLANRTTKWRDNDSTKSAAKLRIVDLLIKHGARVNVEDIDGNTPAHYAVFCRSKDENYLKLLAENGADVNIRNVQGKTPLELLIGKGDLKIEDMIYFIACGCIFNEFTLDKQEGYIALANTMIPKENMENLLEETFTNYPDSMKRDSINRSAIHNLVSTEFYKTDVKQVAALVDIMMRFDCDADDQDNLGRTALHLAARFRNDITTKAMLLVGADFSITDEDGKTPLAYLFKPCLCKRIDDEDELCHEASKHPKISDALMFHVRKMQISGLCVDELNRTVYGANEIRFDHELAYEILQNFRSELWYMAQMKIEPYSIRLADFVSRAKAVFDYPRMPEAKRDAIDAFFMRNKSPFRNGYPNAAGIFQLQYRQAVLRRKMMVEAKDSLSVLARLQVPEICSDIILRFLKNSEIRKLITSTR